MNAILPFIIEHWASISAIVAAIGLRLFPTEKNYDVFQKVLRLLDLIVPNIKKGGGRHGVAKIILFFVLASVSVESFAQLNTRTRQIRFATGVQKAADTTANADNAGRIWYDFVTGRYRANESGINKFLIGGSGGGSSYTFQNGITETGGNVSLGGTIGTSTVPKNVFISLTESSTSFASQFNLLTEDANTGISLNGKTTSNEPSLTLSNFSAGSPVSIVLGGGDLGLSSGGLIDLTSLNLNTSEPNPNQYILSIETVNIGQPFIDQAEASVISGIANDLDSPENGLSLYNVEGSNTSPTPGELTIYGGMGFTGSGNNVGGSVIIASGDGSGTAADGNVYIGHGATTAAGTKGGWIILEVPTTSPCSTAPSGALWNDGGILKICP